MYALRDYIEKDGCNSREKEPGVGFAGHPFNKTEQSLHDDFCKCLKPAGNESHLTRAEVE